MDLYALVPILGVLVGGMVVLVPVAGLTARFALKPLVEAFARAKEAQDGTNRVHLLEQRISLLEEQLHALERDTLRLQEESEFRRRLEEPLA